MGINEKIDKIKNIPLREVLESYGAVFINERQFKHRYFGDEKSPSGFIYSKGNEEKWKHFKSGNSGDHIDFVQIVTGLDRNAAINSILGEDKHYSIVDKAERIEKQKQEDRAKAEKDRKKMFAIIKNSVPIIESNLAVEYFQKRGIDKSALTLQDPNIDIRINSFTAKDGQVFSNICYLFNGSKKLNTHRFMIMKGIDSKSAEKNGIKLNLMESRPIIHQSEVRKPFLLVEGIEDGLSGKELGYKNFISLNSTNNINKFITTMNKCRKWFSNNSFEVCLDNDESGRKAMNKLKTFTNLAEMYNNGTINNLKEHLKDDSRADHTLKLLEKDIREMNDNELITVVNNLGILLDDDYFKDYGTIFNVKDSEYYELMKQLGHNDLNDLLLEQKNNLDQVIDIMNDIEKIDKSREEVTR